MQKKYFYIANWKAYLPCEQAINWCKQHADELKKLADSGNIIICPDFLAISEIKNSIAPISVGAQNCSVHGVGAFTGEISAESLREVGVQYCIIGHSERRRLFGETPDVVAKKMGLLLHNGIVPIVCVSDAWEGETAHFECPAKPKAKTDVSRSEADKINFIIAYEPISAIGTGNIAPTEKIEKTLHALRKKFTEQAPEVNLSLLYGGSVNGKNCAEVKKIELLDGFLIGKASTDFQELKTMVLAE